MEHDQRVCPRCGEGTGGYGFCRSCRSQIDSTIGAPGRAGAHATDPSQLAAQVLRLEQALAAASEGFSDRIPGDAPPAGVQVDPDPSVDESRRGDEGGDRAQPPREVARLEDVLSVSEAEGAQNEADETTADGNVAPVGEIKLLTNPEDRADHRAHASREVARLEDVLTVAPVEHAARIAPKTAAAAPPAAQPAEAETEDAPGDVMAAPAKDGSASAEMRAGAPSHVAAHALRAAFWYEQTSAFESRDDREATSVAPPQAVAPTVDSDRAETERTGSTPPPVSSAPHSEPCPERPEAPSADRISGSHWVAALCLLALIALVIVLTGRDPRRRRGGTTS